MITHLQRLARLGYVPTNALDIGAYDGAWAEQLKRAFPAARIHCFEAQDQMEPALKGLTERHPDIGFTKALLGSDSSRVVEFHVQDTKHGSRGSSIYKETTGFETRVVAMPIQTVDEILEGVRFPPVDFIKIDVQGAEIDVLKGAVEAMKTAEVLVTELSLVDYNEGAPLIHEVMSFLAEHGFVLYEIADTHRRKNQTLIQIDGIFVKMDSPLRQKANWWKTAIAPDQKEVKKGALESVRRFLTRAG